MSPTRSQTVKREDVTRDRMMRAAYAKRRREIFFVEDDFFWETPRPWPFWIFAIQNGDDLRSNQSQILAI
jgi:hypothetical protein